MLFFDTLIQDNPFSKAFKLDFPQIVAEAIKLNLYHMLQADLLLLKLIGPISNSILDSLNLAIDDIVLNF